MAKPSIKETSLLPADKRGDDLHQVIFKSGDDATPKNIVLMTRSTLKAGSTADWHQHAGFDEVFMVEEGEGTVSFETGESFLYKRGDIVNCPEGISHTITTGKSRDSVLFFIRIQN